MAQYWKGFKAAKPHICNTTGDIINKGEFYFKRKIGNYVKANFHLSQFGYWLNARYDNDPCFWMEDSFVEARLNAVEEFGSLEKARLEWMVEQRAKK